MQTQAASKSGARSATSPTGVPSKVYAARNVPTERAPASASASTIMLRRRRRALKPSNISGVSLKNRTMVLRHGVYRPRQCASSVADPAPHRHDPPGPIPAEFVDAWITPGGGADVVVVDDLEPRAAVGRTVGVVAGFTVEGLVKVGVSTGKFGPPSRQ